MQWEERFTCFWSQLLGGLREEGQGLRRSGWASKEDIGAYRASTRAWWLEVRVYNWEALRILSDGKMAVTPCFSAVCPHRWDLEELTDGRCPHHAGKVEGFNTVFDTEQALEVACSGLFVPKDDVEIREEKLLQNLRRLCPHYLGECAAVRCVYAI